jgi:hypothetical protein
MCAVLGSRPLNTRATRHARTSTQLGVDGLDVAHARSLGLRAPAYITSVPVILVAGTPALPVVVPGGLR